MNIQITGKHLEITPSIRDYVTAKFERINRHFENVTNVNVILSVEKLEQKVEANVHLSGRDIHVQANDADLYAAIDALVDKLDRQIIKHKEKFQESRHAGSAKRTGD